MTPGSQEWGVWVWDGLGGTKASTSVIMLIELKCRIALTPLAVASPGIGKALKPDPQGSPYPPLPAIDEDAAHPRPDSRTWVGRKKNGERGEDGEGGEQNQTCNLAAFGRPL